jgi:sugar phosphate isomerase/epimerase
MKLAVFTVMLPEYEPAEAVKLLAENGYHGVEWRIREVPKEPVQSTQAAFWSANKCTIDLDTLLDQAEAVRDLTLSSGLEMCNLATYLEASQFEQIEMVMQAAQIMGAPSLRVGVPRYRRGMSYDELFADGRESLAKVEKLAQQYEVKALVELHMGNITPSASAARRLLEPFDPDYIGAIYDPGNMMYEGYEQWRMGLEILGAYLGHVHAKNTLWKPVGVDEHGVVQWKAEAAPMDAGMADWGLIIDDLKAVGYDGFISFEDFSDLPTAEKLPRNAQFLRKLLA